MNPQPESSLDIELEEPDFSAITASVEADEEEEIPPVEPVAEAEKKPAEKTPPEEPPVKVEVSESEKPPEEKEPPVEVAAGEKETPPEVKTDAEVKAEAEAKAEAKAKVEAEAVPEVEPIKVPTMEELQGMYKDHREATLPKLEEIFTLTEEDAAALDERPSKMIPKLAGQMMYDTMFSTYNAILAALPTVIGTVLKASNSADVAETQFFDAWPDLTGKKADPVVSAAIQAYRSANPRADLNDIIQGAGVMAMINLGLDPLKKKEEEPPKEPVVKVVPAKPAAPRGASPTPPKSPGEKPKNEFDELTALFMEDN